MEKSGLQRPKNTTGEQAWQNNRTAVHKVIKITRGDARRQLQRAGKCRRHVVNLDRIQEMSMHF